MSQNTSTAVMQRRVEPHDSLDDFPTPPWGTRALCEKLGQGRKVVVREPTANRGFMVRPLREYFDDVHASDIFDYGCGFAQDDYLFGPPPFAVDWTIANPPYRLAEQFILRALHTSRLGVAMLLRTSFLEGRKRYQSLFRETPPTRTLQFVERLPMVKGRVDPEAVSATSYMWFVWESFGAARRPVEWIEPCRNRLEHADDYTNGAGA